MTTNRTIPLDKTQCPTFLVSPSIELLHAIDLAVMVDGWEGRFAPWVHDAREALAPEEYEALAACNVVVRWERLVLRLAHEGALERSVDWLLNYLRNLDPSVFLSLADEGLLRLANRPLGAIEKAMVSLLKRSGVNLADPKPIAQRVAEMLGQDPAKLPKTYADTIEAFFETSLRSEWERAKPVLEREVAAQTGRIHPTAIPALVEQLTGRPATLPDELIAESEQLLVVPTTLLGPHITLSRLTGEGRKLLIYGIDSGVGSRDLGQAPSASIHVRFKALGEETRFRIVELLSEGEMYAHEIGLRFPHLGQPAISRHLRHLVSAGILTVRDAQAKKYYSLNLEHFRELEGKLSRLAGRADESSQEGESL